MQDLKIKIRGFIVDNFLFGDDEGLEDGTSFFESGIVDSMGILEIINFINQEFNIVVAESELLPENLDSIDNIDNYLRNRLQLAANS